MIILTRHHVCSGNREFGLYSGSKVHINAAIANGKLPYPTKTAPRRSQTASLVSLSE